MTNPPYNYPAPAPQPRKHRAAFWTIGIGLFVLAFALLACAGIVGSFSDGSTDPTADHGLVAQASGDAPQAAPHAAASRGKPSPTSAPVLSVRDVTLKVKVTSKQCFGSAGCILEYQVDATVTSVALIKDECDVTYEVGGFKDGAQIHTLTMRDDGTYEQDGYQSGDTSGSSKKLTAKVTDVVC